MSITVNWDNEAMTRIRFTFTGRWTWDDMFFAIDERDAMITGRDYHVDVIMDMLESRQLPANVLGQADTLVRKHASKVRHVVIVGGANRFIKSMYGLFVKVSRVSKMHFHLVDSMEDAYSIIAV